MGLKVASSSILGGGWEAGLWHCVLKEFLVWEREFLIASQFMAVLGSAKLFFRIYLQVIVYVPVQCGV